jgi:hypothetical protein
LSIIDSLPLLGGSVGRMLIFFGLQFSDLFQSRLALVDLEAKAEGKP